MLVFPQRVFVKLVHDVIKYKICKCLAKMAVPKKKPQKVKEIKDMPYGKVKLLLQQKRLYQ